MELYLIRHGEMAGEPHVYYQPPVQGCLSELGCQQAAALGQALADVPLTAIHASPLGRALQTAQALAQGRGPDGGDLTIGVHEWLIEWRPATQTGECPDPAQYEAMMQVAAE
ncbi:MAG: histidine phosphatase family protein, partial [Phycisphaerae bacterium]